MAYELEDPMRKRYLPRASGPTAPTENQPAPTTSPAVGMQGYVQRNAQRAMQQPTTVVRPNAVPQPAGSTYAPPTPSTANLNPYTRGASPAVQELVNSMPPSWQANQGNPLGNGGPSTYVRTPQTPQEGSNWLAVTAGVKDRLAAGSQDVATPAPFGQQTINTKTGDAFIDGAKVGNVNPPPTYGPETEHGKVYDEEIMKILRGEDPIVQALQRQNETNASRREYLARNAAAEQAAQAGATAGTSRYRRINDREMAGAREANLADTQGLFDTARNRRTDALNAALGVEERTFGRRTTAETKQDAKDIQGKAEIESLINSVGNSKLKYHLRAVQAAGGDVKAAYATAIKDGTIDPKFQDRSTVGDIKAEAEEWVDMLQPGLSPEDRAIAVRKRMEQIDTNKRKPLQDGEDAGTAKSLSEKLRLGETLTGEEEKEAIRTKLIPSYSPATVPVGENAVKRFLSENPHGKFSISGEVYTVVRGSDPRTSWDGITDSDIWDIKSPRHTSVAEVKNSKGETKYFYNGGIHDAPPKTA